MRSGYRKKWDNLNNAVEAQFRKIQYRRSAKIRIKRMNGGFPCDKEYKEIVVPFWKKYGIKPKKIWYKIFSATNQQVDPRYIPDDMWWGDILPYFNNMQFRRFGEDKCMHAVWFSDFKRPTTLVMNIAGVYYDGNFKIITKEDALKICASNKDFLIKPSIDSGEGRLIHFFDENNNDEKKILEVFDDFEANFIAQEVVKQHSTLSMLNESSLNTIRVVSFLFKGEVYILSSILRMGASGARVDNIGAGGFACPIKPDGKLNNRGVNRRSEWKTENQNGIKFEGITVPSYDKVIELIKEKHKVLPHFKLIGWDFSVDEGGEPVFIEYNVCPGPNQITCGPTFADITEEVLEEVFIKKTLKNSQN